MFPFSLGKIFLGLFMTAILAISPLHASAEGEKCADPPQGMNKFRPLNPPKPASQEPFFENGETQKTLADYRGKGIVVNFWATWCGPCVREMPALDRLQAKGGELGLVVLAMSEDRKGAEVVEPFYSKHAIEHLKVLIDRRGALSRKMNVRGLPTTVLIDAKGMERGRVIGTAEWDLSENAAFLSRCLGG